jgi:hypothetical protein
MSIFIRFMSVSLISLFNLVEIVNADFITATVTADNHYAIYTGEHNGMDLILIGRNELNRSSSLGENNWAIPETWTFDLSRDRTIYVATWSDNITAQAWLGQFANSTTNQIAFTNYDDWLWMPTNNDLNDGSPAPDVNEVSSFVSSHNWQAIPHLDGTNWRLNGDQPWGKIPGISTNADWIWGTPIEPGSGAGEYHIYAMKPSAMRARDMSDLSDKDLITNANAVPESSTLSFMVSSFFCLLGFGLYRKRKKAITFYLARTENMIKKSEPVRLIRF